MIRSYDELTGTIQHLLAEDDDVAELGVEAICEGGAVILRGQVNSAARRELIASRVQELAPDLHMRCEITVIDPGAPEPSA
jgi:hypothetical protein